VAAQWNGNYVHYTNVVFVFSLLELRKSDLGNLGTGLLYDEDEQEIGNGALAEAVHLKTAGNG